LHDRRRGIMLDDLDRIPWSTLEHAYGAAGDVPDILRAMVSSDPDKREWAEDMLDMGPFHQGSLYFSFKPCFSD